MQIDIAFSLNRTIYLSLLVLMNSIVSNTSQPRALRFNVVVPKDDAQFFQTKINAAFPVREFDLRIREFEPPEFLKTYLDTKFTEADPARRISRYMQYSRLFLGEIFPGLNRTIYFDTDIVVLGDVADLYKSIRSFAPDQYLAAVPHCFPAFLYFSNPFALLPDLRQFKRTFNSGVLLIDFSYWGDATFERLRHYFDLDRQHHYRLFHLGDETVMNLMFKNFIPLNKSWNRCGYGNARLVTQFIRCDLNSTNAIHWSGGHHKPWRSRNIIYSDIWDRYNQFAQI